MEEEDLDDESINDAAIMKKDEDFESDEDIEDITDWSMNIDNETIESGDEYDLPPVEEDLENLEEGGIGCVYVVNDVKFDWLEEETSKKSTDTDRPLYALILTPTRELAIQIKDHIDNAAKYTGIKTAVVVGGMAQQKQERILKKCPEIVIATPGRLWELIEQKNPHLSKISSIRQLVIDEADRMVEKGHFAELEQILGMINSDPEKKKLRQTYVFSATLTLIHNGPDRVILKKKKKFKMTEEMKLGSLIEQVGLKEKPKIIDLSNKGATADQLTEARINCSASEKDLYVYYLLKQYPGRTLLFTNSKDCLRRVNNIFSLLQCCPLAIHADMHQRQRLKNLDRFKGNPRGFLLATDVAARGLDIPGVQHVIHYQVPRTTENYVHRSGRTARADKEGLSVMLVAPDDVKNYRKIIKTLNRDEDLPSFPVEPECIPALKMRLNLALEIDKVDHRESKLKMQNSWFERAAKEMDVEIDEKMLLHDMGDSFDQAKHKQKLALLRTQLKRLLHEPLALRGKSGKYPTKSGQLVVPFYTANVNASALECMKSTTKPVETTITASKKSKKFKRRFKNKSNMQNSN